MCYTGPTTPPEMAKQARKSLLWPISDSPGHQSLPASLAFQSITAPVHLPTFVMQFEHYSKEKDSWKMTLDHRLLLSVALLLSSEHPGIQQGISKLLTLGFCSLGAFWNDRRAASKVVWACDSFSMRRSNDCRENISRITEAALPTRQLLPALSLLLCHHVPRPTPEMTSLIFSSRVSSAGLLPHLQEQCCFPTPILI